ncbi:hypothetical protein BDV93DRAFT_528125 [Ceratobasidium sp. AG-I]|nr:hypothetical protein BDV93DRAFT_528125 [Ceratobasidium sp. AG-I]
MFRIGNKDSEGGFVYSGWSFSLFLFFVCVECQANVGVDVGYVDPITVQASNNSSSSSARRLSASAGLAGPVLVSLTSTFFTRAG